MADKKDLTIVQTENGWVVYNKDFYNSFNRHPDQNQMHSFEFLDSMLKFIEAEYAPPKPEPKGESFQTPLGTYTFEESAKPTLQPEKVSVKSMSWEKNPDGSLIQRVVYENPIVFKEGDTLTLQNIVTPEILATFDMGQSA